MLSTRKLWWAALVLAPLTVGCSNEPAATTSDTPAVSNTAAPAPETPPPAPPVVDKGALKAEMPADAGAAKPAPDAKGDAPADIKIEAPSVTPATKGDAPKSAAADAKLSDVEVAAIKTLPADEQTAALKQVVCPVSGKHLGSMKTPVKVSAEGKTFYLCCDGCKEEVDTNPKAVVAKLGNK